MPKNNPQLFTSSKQNWRTPPVLFKNLDKEYNFWLDLAADANNTLCQLYFTEQQNSLSIDWKKYQESFGNKYKTNYAWCNPPYGRDLVKWMQKAYEENLKGFRSVWLIPSRTDTKFFHNYILNKAENIGFVKGRIGFIDEHGVVLNKATFPSLVVSFPGCKVVESKFYTLTPSGIII